MNFKMTLARTTRSDVICVSCGRFLAEHAFILADGTEADYGVHKSDACIRALGTAKRSGSQKRSTGARNRWASMTPAQRAERVAKMQAGRRGHAAE